MNKKNIKNLIIFIIIILIIIVGFTLGRNLAN